MLTQLAASGDNFTNAFHVFLTYPFVDEVVGRDPQVARNLHMGDYTNLSITLEVDLSGARGLPTLPTNLPTQVDPTVIVNNVLDCLASGDLTSAACQKVLANTDELTQLREECQKPENHDKDVCRELNLLPGLPRAPETTLRPRSLPTPPAERLPTVPPASAGPAPAAAYRPRARPYGQLMDVYDPALVSLLVPGMVLR